MKYFTYNQNRNYGEFHGARYIIIEAKDADEANSIAESRTPISFDGCSHGDDCHWCGDRWDRALSGTKEPMVYGMVFSGDKQEVIDKNLQMFADFSFGYDCDIYFKDGTVKEYRFSEDDYKNAKTKYQNTKPFVWGFVYNANWTGPTKTFKAYQSDYSKAVYCDAKGNTYVRVKKNSKSNLEFGDHVSVYDADKKSVEKKRENLMEILQKINSSAQQIIEENKDNLDANLYKALTVRFK